MDSLSPMRRQEILAALRRGAVPSAGLDLLAVGLEPELPGPLQLRLRKSTDGGGKVLLAGPPLRPELEIFVGEERAGAEGQLDADEVSPELAAALPEGVSPDEGAQEPGRE